MALMTMALSDEVSLAEFNAQLAAQSARNAKAAMEIGPDEFDQAFAADERRGSTATAMSSWSWPRTGTGRLTKTYRVTRDGKIEKDPNPIGTGFGRLARVILSRDQPIASLAKVLRRCQQNQALMMGRIPGDAPMRRMTIKAKYEALPEADRALAGSGPLPRQALHRLRAGQTGAADHRLRCQGSARRAARADQTGRRAARGAGLDRSAMEVGRLPAAAERLDRHPRPPQRETHTRRRAASLRHRRRWR